MKNLALFLVLFISILLIGCKEDFEGNYYIIQLDKKECLADKDGGDFSFRVLKYRGNLQLYRWDIEDSETTQCLYQSATGDTLITNWYKAVLDYEDEPIVKVSVFPNETLEDRADYIEVSGDNCSTAIDIKQAAF